MDPLYVVGCYSLVRPYAVESGLTIAIVRKGDAEPCEWFASDDPRTAYYAARDRARALDRVAVERFMLGAEDT